MEWNTFKSEDFLGLYQLFERSKCGKLPYSAENGLKTAIFRLKKAIFLRTVHYTLHFKALTFFSCICALVII